MGKLKITWVKSSIGYAEDQKGTIRALGLRRLNHSVEHEDSPSLQGMLHKVRHLVRAEPVAEAEPVAASGSGEPSGATAPTEK